MTMMQALIGFCAVTMFLVMADVGYRLAQMARGIPVNAWTRGASIPVPRIIKRIQDAHLNCLENLPLFGILVLVAAVMGKNAFMQPYAPYVLYARTAQSAVHVLGTSQLLVTVRATFMAVQWTIFGIMMWELWRYLPG